MQMKLTGRSNFELYKLQNWSFLRGEWTGIYLFTLRLLSEDFSG